MTELLLEKVRTGPGWHRVCPVADLEVGWGEAAVVDGRQVALVRLGAEEVYAVSHRDPATGAHVLARGIVGSRLVDGVDRPTIASPLHKEVYDLATGECYTAADLYLETYPVRVVDGFVEIGT
jgi:nitrite reductase (NADH) small subunit